MDPVTTVALIAAIGAALALPMVLRARSNSRRQADPVWRAVAARRGGSAGADGLAVEVDDVRVHVTLQAVVKGQPDIRWYVRARAAYVCGSGPSFEIAEQGFGAALGRSVGLRVTDVTFGDAAFEEQFVVHTDDAPAVAGALSDATRARLVRIPQQKWAHADGRNVVVEVEESMPTVVLVEALVDMAAAVAGFGRERLERLRGLPGARSIARARAQHGFACVEVAGPHASVTVGPRDDAPAGSLVAWTRAREGTTFSVDIEAGALVGGELPRGLLSPVAAGVLQRVGRAELESDGDEIRILWVEWPDAGAIEAGVELLDAIAAPPSAGAFR
ncbi:MAG: hypothetical protein IT379_17280 [Deltaproteobacteria bacterium]|nr:hypothetical protein [Deltaproteobacteria bacterium]